MPCCLWPLLALAHSSTCGVSLWQCCRGDPGEWMGHVRTSHHQQQQGQGRERGSSDSSSSGGRRQQRQEQSQQEGEFGSSSGRAAQPRPYFWRMQQHMMARCVGVLHETD